MKLIDKLVWKDLIGPFINGLFMFLLLVFAAGSLFQATDWLVKGIPPAIVFKLVIYNLPSVVTQTFPMAIFEYRWISSASSALFGLNHSASARISNSFGCGSTTQPVRFRSGTPESRRN